MNIQESEADKLNDKLTQLRQAIMQAEPNVLLDGRFEQMIVNPISILDIARKLIEQQPSQPQTHWMAEVE